MAEPIVFQGLTLDQATAMARSAADAGAKTSVTRTDGDVYTLQITFPSLQQPAADAAGNLTFAGRMSTFGGPNDNGVGADEGLALMGETDVPRFPGLFLPQQPPNTTGVARRLNPDAYYIACRWDYGVTPQAFLKSVKVRVTNPANGKSEDAQPVDWGPNASTNRIADLSPKLAQDLGLNTDFPCTVEIPAPPAPAAAAVTSGIAAKIEDTATAEWNFFGGQTYDANGHTTHAGHKEGEDGFYERVGTYWLDGTGTHSVDGRTDLPWSAAFISWVMKAAGAGTRFRYSTQHSVYIFQAIRDLMQKRADAGFYCWRLNEMKPKIGDLVCWSRQSGIDYDHQEGGNYKGHTDLVVEVLPDRVNVIGGNVGDSVTRRPVPLGPDGYLRAAVVNGETLFGLMENRMS